MNLVELIFKAKTSELSAAKKELDSVAKSTAEAEKGTSKLRKGFDSFKGASGPVGEAADKVEDLAGSLGGAGTGAVRLASLLGTAVGVVVGATAAIQTLAFQTREFADAQGELADKLGVTQTRLAGLQLLAKENGSSAESLTSTYDRLAKALNKAEEDTGKAEQALKIFGITAEEAGRMTREELAGKIVQGYELLDRSSKATAAAQVLLGTSFRDNIPAIKAAEAGLAEYEARAQRFGAVITPDLIAAGDEQEKAMSELGLAWQGLSNEVSRWAGSMLSTVASWSASMLNGIRRTMRGMREATDPDNFMRAQGENLIKVAEQLEKNYANGTDKISLNALKSAAEKRAAGEKILAELNAANEQARELAALANRAEAAAKAAAQQRAAGINLTPPKAPGAPQTSIAGDATGAYDAFMAKRKKDAEDMARLQADIDAKATQYYANEIAYAERVRDQLEPVRVLKREILQIEQSSILTDKEKALQIEAVTKKYKEQNETVKKGQEEVNLGAEATKYVFGQVANTIGDAFTTGEFNFKQFLGTLLQGLAKLIIQLTIIEPLMQSLGASGGGGGGGGLWGAIGNAFISMTGGFTMAKGGAFSGGVQKFAKGGVVNSPTMFGMSAGRAGVMGEAGPEAIMPLKRGKDGKLGVAGAGGGGTVVQNSISVQIGSVDSDERQAALVNELNKNTELITKKTMADAMRPGGMLYARRNAMA